MKPTHEKSRVGQSSNSFSFAKTPPKKSFVRYEKHKDYFLKKTCLTFCSEIATTLSMPEKKKKNGMSEKRWRMKKRPFMKQMK